MSNNQNFQYQDQTVQQLSRIADALEALAEYYTKDTSHQFIPPHKRRKSSNPDTTK
jgi:hypothetical protein